ncbi:MAG: hypothetical protein WCJ82_07740, partial [Actinomycetota bacterium]
PRMKPIAESQHEVGRERGRGVSVGVGLGDPEFVVAVGSRADHHALEGVRRHDGVGADRPLGTDGEVVAVAQDRHRLRHGQSVRVGLQERGGAGVPKARALDGTSHGHQLAGVHLGVEV